MVFDQRYKATSRRAHICAIHHACQKIGSPLCCENFKEGSHSGLVRTLGKRVWGNSPRVRIPPLPPHKNDHMVVFMCLCLFLVSRQCILVATTKSTFPAAPTLAQRALPITAIVMFPARKINVYFRDIQINFNSRFLVIQA